MSKLRIFDSARTKNVSAKGLIVVFRIVSIGESVGFFSDRQRKEKDTKAKGLKIVLFPNCQCKRRLRRF